MNEELKPCPHCGGTQLRFERWISDDTKYHSFKTLYRVLCATCLYAPDNWEETAEKVIQHWNTRPIEAALLTRAESAEAELATLREQTRWILVSERLPEHFDLVQVALGFGGGVCEARHSEPRKFDYTCKGWHTVDGFCLRDDVTHWMPLPIPPEEV